MFPRILPNIRTIKFLAVTMVDILSTRLKGTPIRSVRTFQEKSLVIKALTSIHHLCNLIFKIVANHNGIYFSWNC